MRKIGDTYHHILGKCELYYSDISNCYFVVKGERKMQVSF